MAARGIPSRLVNGFWTGTYNPVGKDFVVRARDAHSWVEAYFPGFGWSAFDPTPAAGRAAGLGALAAYLDALGLFWNERVVNKDADPTAAACLYRQLLKALGRRGLHKPASQTPRQFAESVAASRHPPVEIAVVAEFSRLYNAPRFAGHPLSLAELWRLLDRIDQSKIAGLR